MTFIDPMPSAAEILDGLTTIANDWWSLAVLWHGYFAILGLGLVFGIRPARRSLGVLLAIPLLSVSALAWANSNPFNGTLFMVSGFILIALSFKLRPGKIQPGSTLLVIPASAVFAFGWVYPHFLESASFLSYLYSAPTGLIPCPTLSIVIGLALWVRGLDSRAWAAVLGITGMFYGIFGAVGLGVTIDWVLLLGALLVLQVSVSSRQGLTERHS